MDTQRDPWFFQRWARQQKLGNPTRKLILTSLSITAEAGTGAGFMSQQDLAEFAECSMRTVSDHLKALEQAGLMARRKRFSRSGRRLADGFLLLAPEVESWPDGEPVTTGSEAPPEDSAGGDPAQSPPEAQAAEQELPKGTTQPPPTQRARSRQETVHQLPDDLPEALHQPALEAGRVLYRAATVRGQSRVVMLEAVGRAVGAYPTKDHVTIAGRVEHWVCWGNGRRKPCSDIVARFRNFLDDAPDIRLPDGSPLEQDRPLPPGVASIQGRMSNADRVEANIQALRAERERRAAGSDTIGST